MKSVRLLFKTGAAPRGPDSTSSTSRVDPPVFERLRMHLGEHEILELTALVAFQNMTSKFNAALSVPPQGFCTRRAAARR